MALALENRLKKANLKLMVFDANFAVILIAGYGLFRDRNPILPFESAPSLVLMALLFPVLLCATHLCDLDRKWLSPARWLRAIITVAVIAVIFGLGYWTWIDIEGLKGLFLVVAVGMAAEVVVVRSVAVAKVLRTRTARKALVVGAGWAGQQVIDTILHEPRLRLHLVGAIDDDFKKRNFAYKGVQVLGNRHRLREIAANEGVDIVIFAISFSQNAELIENLLQLKVKGVEIVDMPRFCEWATGQVPIKNVRDSWFLYSSGFDLLHRPVLRRVKRAVDILIAAAGLFFSLPLMLITALLIRLDSPGPIFFRQERTGQDESTFNLLKFRSMKVDAEEESGPVWTKPGDYRITRVGRVLRKTRLDEIPQFINILRGDMSIVGPRPERPFFVEKLKKDIPYYSFRFAVKPGLTGWAQVKYQYGASSDDAIEKLKYELYYIKNMSIWLDLLIAFKTVKVVLLARGT